MEPTADRLATHLEIMFAEHQEHDGLAAPATAEEPEVAWGVLGEPLDSEGDPGGGEAKGTTGLVPGQPLDPLVVEPLDPTIDSPEATEQEGTDGRPGVAVGQEEQDVGAEPDLGVAVGPVSVEQRLAPPGVEGDAGINDQEFRVRDMSGSTQLYRTRLLSPLRGAI